MVKMEVKREMETKTQPHCWWFESYNRSKCSPWLQSTLSDLNEKTKTMLKLIDEDADSFAQRAEMYYKKRPELIGMVEDFYRAHRSLAERYDQLKCDRAVRIRSPLPKDYVFDSSNSVKSYDSFTEGTYNSEAAESEVDDPDEEDAAHIYQDELERTKPFSGGSSFDELMKLRDELDRLREENEIQINIIRKKDEEKEEFVKSLSDNINELREFREEMGSIREDNSVVSIKESSDEVSSVPFDEVTKLRDEIERLEMENLYQKEVTEKKAKEVIELTKKFEEAKFGLMKLEEELLEGTTQLEVTKYELVNLINEIAEKDEKKNEIIRQLNNALEEKDEEKREVIRQLSIAIEIMREEGKSLKKKLVNIFPRKG